MTGVRMIAISFAILMMAGIASAQQQQTQSAIDLNGLKPEQMKALATIVEQLRKEPENTLANLTLSNTTPQRFQEWAQAGQAAGQAVSSFTKQLGIAADDFLKTDVGRIGTIALVWRFGGGKVIESLINLVSHFVLAIILLFFWWQLTRRFVFNERHTGKKVYNQNTLLRWLGFNQKEVTYEKDDTWLDKWSADDRFWIVLWSRVSSIAALLAIALIAWPSVSF